MAERCTVPPEGWWCSREPGHDGPCAAREVVTQQDVYRLLAAIYQTRYERFLKRLVTICYALAPKERGPFSAIGDWIDERWSRRVRRRGARASRTHDPRHSGGDATEVIP